MGKKKICILVFSNIAFDARVLREIEAASARYDVDVIGYGDWQAKNENVRFFSLPCSKTNVASVLSKYIRVPLGYLFPAFWERHFWHKQEYNLALQILLQRKYDLIHANDWNSLPVAARAIQQVGGCLLFDAHEYTPAQFADKPLVWFLNTPVRVYLLRKYQENINRAITVSRGLHRLYRDNFGINTDIIMNAPFYVKHEFHPVDPARVNLIHHGGAIPGRNIENLIAMMPELDERFHLNLMLIPANKKYYSKLRQMADRIAPHRIHFLAPVPPNAITARLNQFDIGIPLLRVNSLNYFHSLPNKFFDYVIAGLAIAISPLPEMASIVRENRIGVVSADQKVRSMIETLNQLTLGQIDEFKKNSLSLAKTLNGNSEMNKLMSIYADMLST